jgi:hypothetical protein
MDWRTAAALTRGRFANGSDLVGRTSREERKIFKINSRKYLRVSEKYEKKILHID